MLDRAGSDLRRRVVGRERGVDRCRRRWGRSGSASRRSVHVRAARQGRVGGDAPGREIRNVGRRRPGDAARIDHADLDSTICEVTRRAVARRRVMAHSTLGVLGYHPHASFDTSPRPVRCCDARLAQSGSAEPGDEPVHDPISTRRSARSHGNQKHGASYGHIEGAAAYHPILVVHTPRPVRRCTPGSARLVRRTLSGARTASIERARSRRITPKSAWTMRR